MRRGPARGHGLTPARHCAAQRWHRCACRLASLHLSQRPAQDILRLGRCSAGLAAAVAHWI